MNQDPKVIVALDYADAKQAMQLVEQLDSNECKLKVGKELFTACGPEFVKQLVDLGYDVFLDLKFHDIPTTVRKAVAAASDLGVWMLNVHALGGAQMVAAAREGIEQSSSQRKPYLIAVTVLTSTNQQALDDLGFNCSIESLVNSLGTSAINAGADGLVCSALEVETLRENLGSSPLLVTPGIRPAGSAVDDQKRIMTPAKAIQSGSSYLVVGRPITQAENPLQTLKDINQSLT
ncbi:MAG: orotidine-5'-phosphate decarboxylase [Gammaproteobacteria bacterium]|nr:orotidine-5'-phosphate decarboxylase [Gammaproteobacteria bacterium]